ncbi:2-iminobutanoate/2-iminopropanoate deaminase [Granulicella pectinivorans]|uniref:2-iminobutanoate/2-iminopropanoate deaminase n=1 Tax=Granulicella pectinivorans TaxID=474950 RepID=A0A1I6L552_9BACT|nr:Rid family hydrolase [Granulicella pectinivorans]SFR98566.1 2-iminobutanoate/2-iminopropanoate deaminase [Granulicella pectinivorans]
MAFTQVKNPNKNANTGAYSDGIIVDGWLYVSGQGPLDMSTGQAVPGTIEEEVRLTLKNLGDVLKAGGCDYSDVVKCTVHLIHIEDFARFNAVYQEFFTGILPTRTTVESMLGLGIKVEIDCIARIPDAAAKNG